MVWRDNCGAPQPFLIENQPLNAPIAERNTTTRTGTSPARVKLFPPQSITLDVYSKVKTNQKKPQNHPDLSSNFPYGIYIPLGQIT